MKNDKNFLSLSAAAKQSGISKSVISKAIENKELWVIQVPMGKGKGAKYQIQNSDFKTWEKEYNGTRRQSKELAKNYSDELKQNYQNDLKNTLKIKELELELNSERKERTFIEKQLTAAEKQLEKIDAEKERFLSMLEKKDNLLAYHQEKVALQRTLQKNIFPLGFTVIVSVVVILTVGVVTAILSPERVMDLFPKISQKIDITSEQTQKPKNLVKPPIGNFKKIDPAMGRSISLPNPFLNSLEQSVEPPFSLQVSNPPRTE